jgi:hypothetical protein
MPPSSKVTVPVAAEGVIQAVRVTGVRATGVVLDAVNAVDVVAGVAVTATADEAVLA